jgi:hypothetical protein
MQLQNEMADLKIHHRLAIQQVKPWSFILNGIDV